MTTASTAALVAGGQSAFAQDGFLPEGYTLNVQGGYGITDNALRDKVEADSSGGPVPSEVSDKIGDEDSFRQISGSVSLTRQLSPSLDVAFAAGGVVSTDDDVESSFDSGSGGTTTLATGNDLSFGTLDVEAGYALPTDAADIRAFGGLRVLSSRSEIDKVGEFSSGGSPSEEQSVGIVSRFTGIGPRIGIGFATKPMPVGTAGNFSLSAEVAGSYLFGDREDEVESGGSVFGEADGDVEVTTLEAQLGVSYHISPKAKVTVGYELQQLWNVDLFSDDSDDRGYGEDADPRLAHGVFVGFTTSF